MSEQRGSRLARAGALALGGLALVGCSSGPGSSSATTTTRPATTTTTGRATTTTTTTSATTSTTTGAGGPSTCQVAQLHVVPQSASGAAGTSELSIDLTNQSTSSCTLFGYPGMQLLSSSGASLPTDVVRGGGPLFIAAAANQPPTSVVLASQATAVFSLSYEDVPVGTETSCPTSAGALITPPGDTTSATVVLAIAPCAGGTIHVSPVYASS